MITNTKQGEIRRTVEVCQDIIEREGNNKKGMYFLIAFLHDQGRPLKEIMEVLENDERAKR